MTIFKKIDSAIDKFEKICIHYPIFGISFIILIMVICLWVVL